VQWQLGEGQETQYMPFCSSKTHKYEPTVGESAGIGNGGVLILSNSNNNNIFLKQKKKEALETSWYTKLLCIEYHY
jgi:hypothetical protein